MAKDEIKAPETIEELIAEPGGKVKDGNPHWESNSLDSWYTKAGRLAHFVYARTSRRRLLVDALVKFINDNKLQAEFTTWLVKNPVIKKPE